MASDTREQLLDNAEALFAERGFYGASIAAIANELGLTKQALLHHFGSKEKLYGEVLKRISVRFDDLSKGEELAAFDPIASLQAYLLQLHNPTTLSPNATRLLMRELLDNKRRVDTAGTWYLKAFLEGLIAKVKAIPNWHNATDAEALAVVYQLLGAINYYGVSTPTLTGIFGEDGYAALDQAFPKQLKRLINAALTAR
ncbi:MAG: TetR/AcrR family transcriptional regulator [Pseudomonadota bacterium]